MIRPNGPARLVVRSILSLVAGVTILFALHPEAFARTAADDVENLFSREEQEPAPAPTEPTPASTPKPKSAEVKGVSDLDKLSPFSDVAVIQKRYLPRTGRFELFGAPTFVTNDAFFINYGINLRLAYYFRERYGIEFVGTTLRGTEREITRDLRTLRGVDTESVVTPLNFIGLDFKWTPVYGKMTFANRTIVPFDLYFSLGAGTTGTNRGSEPALHIGSGQAFAMSKASAIRWDFSWNVYQATPRGSPRATFNNLYLSIGYSWFFPEATYR